MTHEEMREQARQRLNARNVDHGRDYERILPPIALAVAMAIYVGMSSLAASWGMM